MLNEVHFYNVISFMSWQLIGGHVEFFCAVKLYIQYFKSKPEDGFQRLKHVAISHKYSCNEAVLDCIMPLYCYMLSVLEQHNKTF